ncbi:hypothetical protein MNBD_PLANCTO02-1473 [hydrothermal vent metagenome]|uniref:Uncharacterized protein n=1 Tax=hydrothermal vent metagenome TaxID=652676 RepID=A0A3B1DUT9_9ZZZZ
MCQNRVPSWISNGTVTKLKTLFESLLSGNRNSPEIILLPTANNCQTKGHRTNEKKDIQAYAKYSVGGGEHIL